MINLKKNSILQKPGSMRNYDFVETVEDVIFGDTKRTRIGIQNTTCETPLVGIEKFRDSDNYRLSYCTCDNDVYDDKTGTFSERKFYTGATMADGSDNK